jgi:hypothetical protein
VIEIRQYIDRRGRNPFNSWFEKLEGSARARIAVALDRLERGNSSVVKGVGAAYLSCDWILALGTVSISARTAKRL